MKERVTGYKIYEEVKKAASKLNLPLEQQVSVAIHGAPAIFGSKLGFLAKLKEELTSLNLSNSNFKTTHCIIYQKHLCATSLKCENVIHVVVSAINFIKFRAFILRQFKEFLEELESEYGNLVHYCAIRWLSKGFYSIREELCVCNDKSTQV